MIGGVQGGYDNYSWLFPSIGSNVYILMDGRKGEIGW